MTPANPFAAPLAKPAPPASSNSSEQDQAIAKVLDWHKNVAKRKAQVFRLFGAAGTGKTTMARTIAEQIGGHVQFAAFSGKAASVLRGKGCENATTIHALIYTPQKDAKGKLTFALNAKSTLWSATLIVVDEVSMVDAKLGKDLESFNRPILVLGDRAQLPPIAGAGYFMKAAADFELTEIRRQDRDNPIVQLANDVRTGKLLKIGDYGTSRLVAARDIEVTTILNTDQVLAGKNETVHRFNARIRELLGRPQAEPISGDKLVCLKNNRSKGIFNGEIWIVHEVEEIKAGIVHMTVKSEFDDKRQVSIAVPQQHFTTDSTTGSFDSSKRHDAFTFGNVLTVHRAQGSEWKSIVLFDESDSFGEDRSRWLYTGITRASQSIVVVRP